VFLAWRSVGPYAEPAAQAWRAWRAMKPVADAVAAGQLDEARRLTQAAARHVPRSGRPWLELGRRLLRADRFDAALDAYRRAAPRANPLNHTAAVALPRVLRGAGRDAEADAQVEKLNRASREGAPWLLLETAWRELPPPRTDELVLGWDDYGAVRSFHAPLGGGPEPPYRWSRGRCWLRLFPTQSADAYELTLRLGSPEPSPHPRPEVEVYVNGVRRATLALERDVRAYRFEAPAPPQGEAIEVLLESPTWTALGHPADQGVRVERLAVAPR
jgi:tetratricopeptide (TPR) repeat protein